MVWNTLILPEVHFLCTESGDHCSLVNGVNRRHFRESGNVGYVGLSSSLKTDSQSNTICHMLRPAFP